MSKIAEQLSAVQKQIEAAAKQCQRAVNEITLLAVSKKKPPEAIAEAFAAGQRHFGENYVQEGVDKISALKSLPIEWHYIGSIQSNKTRQIAEHFSWVHSVDSIKHAQRLNDQRPEQFEPLNICVQINISGEASKSGITKEDAEKTAIAIHSMPKLRLRGLMALPAPTDDPDAQAESFKQMQSLFDQLNHAGLKLDTLSMGMSGDMQEAIKHGSTIVRVGTAIFGARE